MAGIIESVVQAIKNLFAPPQADMTPEAIAEALDDNALDDESDWRNSIVDLLKVLDMDSSFAARKQLAEELGHTGEFKDSAEMNTWLHDAVLDKVAEHGIIIPN